MTKKREKHLWILFSFFLILSLSLIFAANDTVNATVNNTVTPATTSSSSVTNSTGYEKSYDCLKNQINKIGYSSLTVEELAFSLIAMGYDGSIQSKLKSELNNRGSNGECWPKNACTLKETSLVLLAFEHINVDTKKIQAWLLNQTASSSELTWYLEIDANEKSECSISYSGNSYKINVNDDKTISGSGGSCFKVGYNGFWLEVDSSCYDKEFEISCNKDFLTTLVYKRKSTATIFVSSLTNSASIGGKTKEKVQSICFKQAGACNYEGSLWASMALNKIDSKVKEKSLPYLMALASDDSVKKLLPSAFLYSITGFDEYFAELINEQNKLGYWQISDTSKRYYDTALAMYALGDSVDAGKAKSYLLDPKVQGDEGCWGGTSIRDTAFLLFSGWPKRATTETPKTQCSDYFSSKGYSCISSGDCDNINGTILEDYSCFYSQKCCSKKVEEKSCSQRGGVKCLASQECKDGDIERASDGSCCIDGTCTEVEEPLDECAASDGTCRISCGSKEQSLSYVTCPESGVCCVAKPEKSYWWVWLLVLLIILVVLAIIFKKQLQLFLFKIKSKFSQSPAPAQTRPPFPPSTPPAIQQGGPRRMMPPQSLAQRPRPMPQRPFPKDKELDETLKKLKDMGK